jgi:hypothetical protein
MADHEALQQPDPRVGFCGRDPTGRDAKALEHVIRATISSVEGGRRGVSAPPYGSLRAAVLPGLAAADTVACPLHELLARIPRAALGTRLSDPAADAA